MLPPDATQPVTDSVVKTWNKNKHEADAQLLFSVSDIRHFQQWAVLDKSDEAGPELTAY
jgi:hypothetical protein